MKIALLGNNAMKFERVFSEDVKARLCALGEVSPRISSDTLDEYADWLKDVEVVFSTWGMPALTEKQIETYLPSLKAVYYCAGTVKYFAQPFFNRGIKIHSAASVNAVPVAEFAFAQISLALKGYFVSARCARFNPLRSYLNAEKHTGCYKAKVGLVGLGNIGSAVAEKLSALDVEVMAYDAFATEEYAERLGVTLVSLEKLFSECDVISNHLADVPETRGILGYPLFRLMKKTATFINTARPAQVKDAGLARALLFAPSRAALIDVTKTEIVLPFNPLFWCRNAFFTPHIAGSTGCEPQRMAEVMIEEYGRIAEGADARFEVTPDMLRKMT